MILQSFLIKNFRSINEVNCYIDEHITILAGKNESGKTNILDALVMLNRNTNFLVSDYPKNNKLKIPEVHGFFELETSDIRKINENLKSNNLEIGKFFTNNIIENVSDIRISKKGDNERFISGENFDSKILNEIQKVNTKLLDKYHNNLTELVKNELIDESKENTLLLENIKLEEIEAIRESIEGLYNRDNLKYNIVDLGIEISPEEDSKVKTIRNDFSELLNLIKEIEYLQNISFNIINTIFSLVTKFVIFKSFEDILPSKVAYTQLLNEDNEEDEESRIKIVKDLLRLSNIDIGELSDTEYQDRENIIRKASKVCSSSFGKYWNQDPIEIKVNADDNNIYIWIYDQDGDTNYRPNQRSKGLQWFLNFFLRLNSESEGERNIILIDEPGAYLHPKAQIDVLDILEDISKENQIIFSTHSPYLINPNKLSRIRLVVKNDDLLETEIVNSFNKESTNDTLTPIITAIGLDLSKVLTISNKLNILVEGISDYYYLTTVLEYLMKDKNYVFPEDISFIPGIGHTQIPYLLSILTGWGYETCILLDRKGTNKTYEMLISEGIEERKILFVGKNDTESIEDLFSDSDRKKNGIQIYSEKEWNQWKKVKKDKAFISKEFANKALLDDFKLTEITLNNFIKIFDKIKELYK